MILKNSKFSIQDNNVKNLDNSSREYETFDDLIIDQNSESKKRQTVHRRRDLDSLG